MSLWWFSHSCLNVSFNGLTKRSHLKSDGEKTVKIKDICEVFDRFGPTFGGMMKLMAFHTWSSLQWRLHTNATVTTNLHVFNVLTKRLKWFLKNKACYIMCCSWIGRLSLMCHWHHWYMVPCTLEHTLIDQTTKVTKYGEISVVFFLAHWLSNVQCVYTATHCKKRVSVPHKIIMWWKTSATGFFQHYIW